MVVVVVCGTLTFLPLAWIWVQGAPHSGRSSCTPGQNHNYSYNYRSASNMYSIKIACFQIIQHVPRPSLPLPLPLPTHTHPEALEQPIASDRVSVDCFGDKVLWSQQQWCQLSQVVLEFCVNVYRTSRGREISDRVSRVLLLH